MVMVMVMVMVGRAVAKQALPTAAAVEAATVENELESATAVQFFLSKECGCWFLWCNTYG